MVQPKRTDFMKLMIRNMVCDRCIESVRQMFDSLQVPVSSLHLGQVETAVDPAPDQLQEISRELESRGFDLIRDRESELIERMKLELLNYLSHLEERRQPEKLSVFIAARLHYNYSYLSKLFSDAVGETVENHLIRLKIERVKELLGYRDRTLSEIAWQLNYSSVQYLSNQFRKVTGQTVTEYLRSGRVGRVGFDRI